MKWVSLILAGLSGILWQWSVPAQEESPVATATVLGTVLEVSKVPDPKLATYKDCLVMARLKVERVAQGACEAKEIVAALWLMKDGKIVFEIPAGSKPRLKLGLVPFSDAGKKIQALQRSDTLDENDCPVFLATEVCRAEK